jgi:hypothetical protein
MADNSSYLNVFNISLTQGVETKTSATCMVDNPHDTLLGQSTLEGLPMTSIRVYVEENLGSNHDFRSHIAQLVSETFKEQYNSVTTSFFTRLISQYRNQTGGPSWLSGSYSLNLQNVTRAYKDFEGVELSTKNGIGISSSLLILCRIDQNPEESSNSCRLQQSSN